MRVAVVMGSQSDWETMKHCSEQLTALDIPHLKQVVSAHRTPDKMITFAEHAHEQGIDVIIAGAGGAAHLPGMIAAKTHLPVIGVPVMSKALQGVDSLLSIAQMPKGVAVATMSIGASGAANAALMAASILALQDVKIRHALIAFRQQQTQQVLDNDIPG